MELLEDQKHGTFAFIYIDTDLESTPGFEPNAEHLKC